MVHLASRLENRPWPNDRAGGCAVAQRRHHRTLHALATAYVALAAHADLQNRFLGDYVLHDHEQNEDLHLTACQWHLPYWARDQTRGRGTRRGGPVAHFEQKNKAELFSLMRFFYLCTMERMDEQMPCAGDPLLALPAPERPTISDRKLAANRENAQRSTGPRTARGKARSAMNAVKHGVLAKRHALARPGVLSQGLVLPKLEGHRASAQFRALMSALIADRKPVGALEMLMVQEIGVCTWRLRRLLRFENRAAYLTSLDWAAETDANGEYHYKCDKVLEPAGLNGLSMPEPDEVVMISRYENGLMRHLFRAIDQLDRMQRQHRAEASKQGTEKSAKNEPANRYS
jgi:hypothetical protein